MTPQNVPGSVVAAAALPSNTRSSSRSVRISAIRPSRSATWRRRTSATYPHDLFFEKSLNLYLRRHFDLSCGWEPPARWVCQPVGGACVNAPPAVLGDPQPFPPARLGIPY